MLVVVGMGFTVGFISVAVPFAPATAAPDESLTVPSNVALTACPMTGAEKPRSIVPSTTAMLNHHSLTSPLVAARESFMLCIHGKNEPNSFFMTSPHSIRKTPAPVQTKTTKPLELVPHPI